MSPRSGSHFAGVRTLALSFCLTAALACAGLGWAAAAEEPFSASCAETGPSPATRIVATEIEVEVADTAEHRVLWRWTFRACRDLTSLEVQSDMVAPPPELGLAPRVIHESGGVAVDIEPNRFIPDETGRARQIPSLELRAGDRVKVELRKTLPPPSQYLPGRTYRLPPVAGAEPIAATVANRSNRDVLALVTDREAVRVAAGQSRTLPPIPAEAGANGLAVTIGSVFEYLLRLKPFYVLPVTPSHGPAAPDRVRDIVRAFLSTYRSEEDGRTPGVIPGDPEVIRRTRRGDCKGLSALLAQELRQAGAEVEYVFVSRDGPELSGGAGDMLRLDHVLLYLPELDAFVETGAPDVDPFREVPTFLLDKPAYFLGPLGVRLGTVRPLSMRLLDNRTR